MSYADDLADAVKGLVEESIRDSDTITETLKDIVQEEMKEQDIDTDDIKGFDDAVDSRIENAEFARKSDLEELKDQFWRENRENFDQEVKASLLRLVAGFLKAG